MTGFSMTHPHDCRRALVLFDVAILVGGRDPRQSVESVSRSAYGERAVFCKSGGTSSPSPRNYEGPSRRESERESRGRWAVQVVS